MRRESFSPRVQRQPVETSSTDALQEPEKGAGYSGAKNELVQKHGLLPSIVEKAMSEAAEEPGKTVTVAEQNGFVYEVTANANKADSYFVETRATS